MYSLIGMLIGGLVPTYVLSALIIWTMKTWQGGVRKLLVAHAGSLLIATLLAGMGKADGGAFAPVLGLEMYILPQLFWLAWDIFRLKRKQARTRRQEVSEIEIRQ